MSPSFWKKDQKDKDKNKHSRHHTADSSSSRHHQKPTPEENEYAESSSRKQRSVLDSVFFRDETVAPVMPKNHKPKDTKPSKHESSKKSATSHSHHHTKPAHQDRHVKSPMKHEERPEKPNRHEKPEPKIKFRTAFTDPKDIEMAEKQTRLKTLKPEELEKQHKWAQEKLQTHGLCPAGFTWWEYNKGVDEAGNHLEGYRCWAGNHLVTHELLAEAKGGCYTKHNFHVVANLKAAKAARDAFGVPGSPINHLMPQYPGGINPMMPGWGGGPYPGIQIPPGFQYASNYPGFQQSAPQIPAPRAPIRPTPPGYRTWFGPDYTAANNNPAMAQPVAPVSDQLQNFPPHWVVRGD